MKKTSSIFFFFYKETRSFCSNVDDIEGVGFFLTNINSSYQQQEAATPNRVHGYKGVGVEEG
jgi:hypothetical protein